MKALLGYVRGFRKLHSHKCCVQRTLCDARMQAYLHVDQRVEDNVWQVRDAIRQQVMVEQSEKRRS